MEPDEEVVSDVHVFLTEQERIHKVPDQHFRIYPVFRSRFLFRDVTSSEEEAQNEVMSAATSALLDEDGDLILPRRQKTLSEVVYLEHAMSTHLPDVGLQVWPGCMILCDFIIDNRKAFDNKVVLELGAGVGLASIVVAMFAKKVIATDVNDDVLTACSNNVALNKHLFNSARVVNLDSSSLSTGSNIPVNVQKLDWDSLNTVSVDKVVWVSSGNAKEELHWNACVRSGNARKEFREQWERRSHASPSTLTLGANQNIACDTSVMNNSIPNFPCCKISTEDIQTNAAESVLDLNTIDILMASDVVYSDDATDGFFRAVYDIMRNSTRCKTLYMSIEKRLNFTLEDLDVACPAYEHFQDCVTYLCGLTGLAGEKFVAEIVPSVPQYFEYYRTQYLELWKITLQKN